MTESEMYRRLLRPYLIKRGYFIQRVEQECIPDIYTMKKGQALWIEMKVWPVHWRPGQLAWIKEHELAGGKVALCLWYNEEIHFLRPKESYTKEDIYHTRLEEF